MIFKAFQKIFTIAIKNRVYAQFSDFSLAFFYIDIERVNGNFAYISLL